MALIIQVIVANGTGAFIKGQLLLQQHQQQHRQNKILKHENVISNAQSISMQIANETVIQRRLKQWAIFMISGWHTELSFLFLTLVLKFMVLIFED